MRQCGDETALDDLTDLTNIEIVTQEIGNLGNSDQYRPGGGGGGLMFFIFCKYSSIFCFKYLKIRFIVIRKISIKVLNKMLHVIATR